MSQPASQNTSQNDSAFTRLVEILVVWWKFLFWCVIVSALISVAIAFIITPKFRSSSSVLPAEKADLFGSLEGVSALVKTFSPTKGLASLRSNSEMDRYMAILKSGRVLGKVIDTFDLVHVYDITSYPIEKTTKELLENVDFTLEDEGFLRIAVYDKDPQRAADMANFFVDELNRTNSELQAQNAKANRSFIEDRYEKNMVDLKRTEDSLKMFQKRFGVIAMPEQIEASVKAGAEIAGELALKEVQLGVQLRTESADHPAAVATRIEIEELKKKIADMNADKRTLPGEMKLLVPFAQIPDLGAEYIRRYRDVEVQYKILQFITPLVEQARVEENRQTPSVIVLDRAYAAERKAKPKRIWIVLGGMVVGLFGSVGYVGWRIKWARESSANSPLYQALTALRASIARNISSTSSRKRESS